MAIGCLYATYHQKKGNQTQLLNRNVPIVSNPKNPDVPWDGDYLKPIHDW